MKDAGQNLLILGGLLAALNLLWAIEVLLVRRQNRKNGHDLKWLR